MTGRRGRAATAGLVLLALAGACSSTASRTAPVPAPATTTTPRTTTTSTTTTAACSQVAQIATWSVAARAAQLITVPALDGNVNGLDAVISRGVGGILLLGGSTPADLAVQVAGAGRLSAVRPFVMADEEGGGVQRLLGRVTSLPWPRQMAATMSPAQIEAAAARTGAQMRALGVDVDLAPVLDLDAGPGPDAQHPDGLRSFSADPTTASRDSVAFLQGLRQGGVVPVVKHFPGLGGATGNTDNGLARSNLSAAALAPFQAAIAAGAPAVMVSNATVAGLSTGPASLSPAVATGLLAGQLHFRGLVVTDSLSAGAVSAAGFDVPAASVAAVEAGADLVLFGSTLTPADVALLSPARVAASVTAIVSALTAAVARGALSSTRLDQAVGAVLAAKGVALCPARQPSEASFRVASANSSAAARAASRASSAASAARVAARSS